MIFTSVSFNENLENPIIIIKETQDNFKCGYYAFENPFTGSYMIFFTYILQNSGASNNSTRIVLPSKVKLTLFPNPTQGFFLKSRPINCLENSDNRIRIKLKQAFSEKDEHTSIKNSQLNMFLFEIAQKINLQEALRSRLMLKDQLVCNGSYFVVSLFKWVLVLKVKTINSNALEYHNMAFPIDEATKISINFFPPRPSYSLLCNSLTLYLNSLFANTLETILLNESSKIDSNIFPQGGLQKCKHLLRLLEKTTQNELLPRICLIKMSEDPAIGDNILQIYLKCLQKSTIKNMKLLYMEAFDREGSMSNVKAIKSIVKAAKTEDDALVTIFFGGMKSLQLNKKHNEFLKFCEDAFSELKRVLIIVPIFFNKEKQSSRILDTNQIQIQYEKSIEISLNINIKALAKSLKDFTYMKQVI